MLRRTAVVAVHVVAILVMLTVVAALPHDGESLTSPIAGGVALPPGLELVVPFESGERVELLSGYSPSGGSSLHADTNASSKANDYYALDMVLPDHANNGLGQPVLAVAAGTVAKAGWATAGWANYGQRIIIRHDVNGTPYHSLYAHLDRLDVSEGDTVARGQPIATLGDSCEGDIQNRSCPFFSPHLHFALHRNSSIGGSGTGGSYGGNAVVPEPMGGYEDLMRTGIIVSGTQGGPAQPCGVIEGAETIIDNTSRCFSRRGPSQYWHEEAVGYGDDSTWTYTIADPAPDNSVAWNLHFAQGGRYELWTYIPANRGQSQQAKYKIRHSGALDVAERSQRSSPDSWLSLGQYDFAEGGDQWVLLEDNTGEPYTNTNGTTIVFDALRIRPANAPTCECSNDAPQTDTCGMCGARTRTCDGCHWSAWSVCAAEGVCTEGTLEEGACGQGGTRDRRCEASCQWGPWGSCTGESPTNNGATNNGTTNNGTTNNGGPVTATCDALALPVVTNGAACDGVAENTWRCACSATALAPVSQVCRSGQWLDYQLDPRDCARCADAYSDACEPPADPPDDDPSDGDADPVGDVDAGNGGAPGGTVKSTCSVGAPAASGGGAWMGLVVGLVVVGLVGVLVRR